MTMIPAWVQVGIAVIVLALSIAGTIVAVTRFLGKMEATLMAKIESTKTEIDGKIESDIAAFRETFTGLRQKINDVELETAKSYVRQEGFREFKTELAETMRELFAKIDGHYDRLDDKIEKLRK